MNLSALSGLLPGTAPPSQRCYRLVDARFSAGIDETAQTVLYSWRYNPKGEFGVLYLSKSRECAYREKLRQVHGRAGDLPAQVAGSFRVHLSKCLDLNDQACRQKLQIELESLVDTSDFSMTQAIAREARRLGFEAIIAPSAAGEACHSLVVFKDKLATPSYCACELESIKPFP